MSSPLGHLLICAEGSHITLVEFMDSKRKLVGEKSSENRHILLCKKQLSEYFEGKRKEFNLPLKFSGTELQEKSWKYLQTIPYGKTVSYQEEADGVGNSKAVRAVANANGRNFISIIIPCHRVIGKNGTLTGYGGGLWRKEWLLKHEKSNS
ncbi:methylated-DNA--[protein]-cysteine S-methyltransferase [bacterium]|nr:methylated-DNA--[protein]-cysteine S-methyltransferase [bacterium]